MKEVAVLYGGISAEREVSLESGRQVIAALGAAGYAVRPVEAGPDLAALIAALTPPPAAVFNALHGRFGEDGAIQGVLDWMGIPYTHSGIRASAMAMDKDAAKAVFAAAELPVAAGRVYAVADLPAMALDYPCVLKPLNEGSSVGVSILRSRDGLLAALQAWRWGARAMVEDFIPGRELTVGVLEDQPLGVTEIIAATDFYDYTAKYAAGGSRHLLPAPIHPAAAEAALRCAVAAHRALGCRGASRADFRYDDTRGEPGRLVLLEVNTQPGMTATSLLPEQAARAGLSFPQLCAWMVEAAACRA